MLLAAVSISHYHPDFDCKKHKSETRIQNIPNNAPNVLRTWASFGAGLLASRSHHVPDWKPLYRLIALARDKLAGDADRLKSLLEKSRQKLTPLEDPFDTDLGLHRWLDEEREEAYSDWLEWIVRQTKVPSAVFRLFNLGTPPDEITQCPHFEAKRECCIAHGHEGHAGRLDLVIRYGDKALIVVEVKKGDADEADTSKQYGYKQWIDEQNCKTYPVLVAVAANEAMYEDFPFVSWGSLCIEMRRLAVNFCRESRVTTAAMVLAFVAAVEQNLLGFSAGLVQEICKGRVALFNAAVVDHLERFVNALEA